MINYNFKKPVFIVNPKSYLYGDDLLKLAKISNGLAEKYDIDILFTGQLVDLPKIIENAHLIVTAQHMDHLTPGRGMGHVLPDALKNIGVKAVVLNHAENPLTLSNLDKTIRRADELGLITIVCADTVQQCKAVAELEPNMIICEPTSLIGTGTTSESSYREETTSAIKHVNSDILVLQAAGVSTGEDVRQVIREGADGTGGTSGIIKAPDWEAKLEEMVSSLSRM
ncbi:triose-phosphate isomerase [Virgibacillus proomii]|jgi:triosephosphate isomerase (TIM)|uniref:triose-phosphate isomerase n=1 Tax=Virgibacillus proomii TaxID=84407 RepID=UPI000985C5F6|nr:triose-phosphate isomerase [Virgibacillus proomii]